MTKEVNTVEINRLRYDTLDWLLGDFNDDDMGLDFTFFRKQSDLLILNNHAPELSEITTHHSYSPPGS